MISAAATTEREKSQMDMQRYVPHFFRPARSSSSTAVGTTVQASSGGPIPRSAAKRFAVNADHLSKAFFAQDQLCESPKAKVDPIQTMLITPLQHNWDNLDDCPHPRPRALTPCNGRSSRQPSPCWPPSCSAVAPAARATDADLRRPAVAGARGANPARGGRHPAGDLGHHARLPAGGRGFTNLPGALPDRALPRAVRNLPLRPARGARPWS